MEIKLSYGGEDLNLKVPNNCRVEYFQSSSVDNLVDFNKFHLQFSNELHQFFDENEKVLIILNDPFRNTPSALLLNWLFNCYPKLIMNADFIIATGAHRPPTKNELAEILGEFYEKKKNQVYIHDCQDQSCLKLIGHDSFGGEVKINSKLYDYDKVLVIGSVEPHYFAGFTGGRKSLIPGLADLKTIERNHNLAVSMEAMPMKLKGNPVAEHLQQLTHMVKTNNIYSLQLILNRKAEVAAIFGGSIAESFEKAVSFSRGSHAAEIESTIDMLIAEIAPPLDKNLYQVQKGLENCQSAVRDGGDIVLVSKCSEGIGSEHFYNLAKNWNQKTNRPLNNKMTFGCHKLSRVLSIKKRININLFSDIDSAEARTLFYEPIDNIEEFVAEKAKEHESFKIAVVRDAGNFLLVN